MPTLNVSESWKIHTCQDIYTFYTLLQHTCHNTLVTTLRLMLWR